MLVKFEQNPMIRTTQNFESFDFWESVDAILEDFFLWLKQLFDSKLPI